jgi:hypothetical protein
MATFSANYNLTLPIGSEDYDIAVVNANNVIIDTALKAQSDAIVAQEALHPSNVKFTADGGIAVQLLNKTGVASVKGSVVVAGTVDDSFLLQSNELNAIGAVYEAGVADGELCWVTFAGIAYVLLADGTGSTAGYWVKSHATNGRADASAALPTGSSFAEVENHFKEIGHSLESKVAGTNVLCKVMLHFN